MDARGISEASEWPAEIVRIFEESFSELVGIAFVMLGSRHEAEEVVQDSVVALKSHWSTVSAPRAYLNRAVTNGSIAVLRRREIAERLRPDPPPPDEPDRLVELRDALLELPHDQRAAIVLRHLVGLDDEAIAEVLDRQQATVRSLVSRGLATLRREVPR
jgi:RNA polymerase sigma factor (sigma-70 family)